MTLTATIGSIARVKTMTTAANKPRIVAPSDAVDLLATLTDSNAPAHLQDAPEDTGAQNYAPVKADRFHITDKSGLEWYARKLSQIRAERDSIKAQAEKMVAALDADEASLKGLYEAEARETTAAILSAGGNKRKSVDTFFGMFAFRTVQGRYAVTDTDAALPHAHALGCTKTTIATDAYLQAALSKLEETGELLPGIAKTDDTESFGLHAPAKRKKGQNPTLPDTAE